MNVILPTLLAAALLAVSILSSAQPDAASSSAPRWSRVADASLARQEIYPAVLDGSIYVAGGILSEAPGFTAYFEAYDAAANKWHKLSPLPEGRHHIALAAAGGKIYGIGGLLRRHSRLARPCHRVRLRPETRSLGARPALPQARAEGVVAAIGDTSI